MGQYILVIFLLSFASTVQADTIVLKSGQKVEGKIISKTDQEINVDFQGVTITYGVDEIEQIIGEEVKVDSNPQVDSSAGAGGDLYAQAQEHFVENKDYEINSVLNAPDQDPEKIKAVFAGNKEAMELFKKAVLQTNDGALFMKAEEDFRKFTRQSFTNLKIMTLILLEAVHSVKSGQLALAEEDYLTIIRFLKHFSRERYVLLTNIQLRISMNKFYPHIQEDMANVSLSRSFYEEFLRELLSVEINPDGFKKTWEGEYEFGRDSFRKMKDYLKGKYNEDFLSGMEPAWETLMAEVVKLQIEASTQNNPDIYVDGITELKASWNKNLAPLNISCEPPPEYHILTEDPLKLQAEALTRCKNFSTPKTLVEYSFMVEYSLISSLNDITRVINTYYTTMSQLNNLTTATAIHLYQIDNQKLPDKLEDLVPKYLAKIPEDPFHSFKPLQYVKTQDGYLVYGVGPDRIDQKGEVAFDLQDTSGKAQEGDIVFFIKDQERLDPKPVEP